MANTNPYPLGRFLITFLANTNSYPLVAYLFLSGNIQVPIPALFHNTIWYYFLFKIISQNINSLPKHKMGASFSITYKKDMIAMKFAIELTVFENNGYYLNRPEDVFFRQFYQKQLTRVLP